MLAAERKQTIRMRKWKDLDFITSAALFSSISRYRCLSPSSNGNDIAFLFVIYLSLVHLIKRSLISLCFLIFFFALLGCCFFFLRHYIVFLSCRIGTKKTLTDTRTRFMCTLLFFRLFTLSIILSSNFYISLQLQLGGRAKTSSISDPLNFFARL